MTQRRNHLKREREGGAKSILSLGLFCGLLLLTPLLPTSGAERPKTRPAAEASTTTLDETANPSVPDSRIPGWVWVITFAAGLAVISLLWRKRNRDDEDSRRSGGNPFQTIALKPIAPKPSATERDAVRPFNPQEFRKVVGEVPRATGPAPAAPHNPTAEHFIYAAAHDLREPLRKVRLFLSRFDQKLSPSEISKVRGEVDGIRTTVSRMQSLLDSLLSLARIEGKGMVFEATDLRTVISQVVGDLETCIAETNATITIEGSLPQLAADRTQLHQLFQNLIANALKFHKEGAPPTVRIEASTSQEPAVNDHPSERSWCEVSIRDEGIGFEKEYWQRMLQGFQRLHSRDRYEGTGLGLAICRCIVERHQGTISAESAPGQGTTIRVRLPLQQHARSGDTTVLVGPQTNESAPGSGAPEAKQF